MKSSQSMFAFTRKINCWNNKFIEIKNKDNQFWT